MSMSLDALAAFANAAELGSFSAAARRLGKSQSTISEAIANLEIDLAVQLFDRGSRQPALTQAGRHLLGYARQMLAIGDELNQQAQLLNAGLEPRLTLVLSDTYQSSRFQEVTRQLEQNFEALELECLVGEQDDVLDLIQTGRAHLGCMAAQKQYPADIGHATLGEVSEVALYVARSHPLAALEQVDRQALSRHRELRLNTYTESKPETMSRRCWFAPSYLMLLEMAILGAGWAELPRWLADSFGAERLRELRAPGWPKARHIDLVWSRRRPLGMAAVWVREQLLRS